MNPYARYLDDRGALKMLAETPAEIERLVRTMDDGALGRSYAPGKWTAGEILLHLAHTEMAFGARARYALSDDSYVVQPFSQDAWVAIEGRADGRAALAAYTGLRALNLALFRRLGDADLERSFTHPERGRVSVRWILELLAGHDVHHLGQLRQCAAG